MNLLRDERGAILIITTVYLPVIVGFFTMAVDMSYVLRTRNTLQVTAEAAALAGSMQLPTKANACPVAKTYATTNMPVAQYGNVLKQNTADCSDVVVGMWTCASGQTCAASNFVPDATSSCGIQCNAVQVTTRMSAANSNSLPLAFASMIGIPTFDVVASAIAVVGNDPGAPSWNVGIVQDISGSFTAEMPSARAGEQALLTCMMNNSGSGSTLGISLFAGTSTSYQAPVTTSDTNNQATLTSKISNINSCGNGSMQACNGGTDIASGINTSIQQICPGGTCQDPTTHKPALVIISDGEPNTCNGQSCAVSTAKANATAAANTAGNLGMDIFVIYYCSDGNCTGTQATSDFNFLSGLVKNNGTALKTPTAAQLATLMTGICTGSHTHRLVW